MFEPYYFALFGGLLIGLASALLLFLNGRIAGVSGIFWNATTQMSKSHWQVAFVLGLPVGAFLFHFILGKPIPVEDKTLLSAVIGGLLVGFGVKLGSGCTSGHGVCGIGRLSTRSIIATCTFMAAGIATVFIFRHVV